MRLKYSVIVPTLLGLFMLLRFSDKLSWLSRWSFAFVVGLGAGITIPNFIHAFILKQLTFDSLITASLPDSINNFLILLGVVSVLIYFFFSLEHKGVIGGSFKNRCVVPDDSLWCFIRVHCDGQDVTPDR